MYFGTYYTFGSYVTETVEIYYYSIGGKIGAHFWSGMAYFLGDQESHFLFSSRFFSLCFYGLFQGN